MRASLVLNAEHPQTRTFFEKVRELFGELFAGPCKIQVRTRSSWSVPSGPAGRHLSPAVRNPEHLPRRTPYAQSWCSARGSTIGETVGSREVVMRKFSMTMLVVSALLGLFGSALLAPGCGGSRSGSGAAPAPTLAAPVDVPAPPSDMRDRIGIYAWGFDITSWPGTADKLSWAATKVAALGSRTIRVYLGPADPYQVLGTGGASDLATAAASPAYAALFANPSFETILLTTYSAADEQNAWRNGYGSDQAGAETAEIARLGAYLLTTFPGKTFIILNWEGDNAVNAFASNPAVWDGYTAWINARAVGVANARAMAPGSSSHIYSGIEFNMVRNAAGLPCDASGNKCVISVVVPNVSVDYYSYSAWQSFLGGLTPAQMATQLQTDLSTALAWAQKRDPSVTPARFIVGEFGAPRTRYDYGECAATNHIAALIGAVPGWGAARAIFWQIIDNQPPIAGSYGAQVNWVNTGYGLYKASGAPGLAAQLFQTLYETQVPTPPAPSSCPTIDVVENAAYPALTAIGPTSSLSVSGSGFSTRGNIVQVRELGVPQWEVTAGSPAWLESPAQITFTLPGIGANQSAFVFVTDDNGLDSNGRLVTVGP